MDWGTIHADWIRRYRTHTDLALEAREVIIQQEGPPEIPGVAVETEETPVGTISRVAITTEDGARAMGKLPGYYTTIEAPAIRQRDQEALERVSEQIARELGAFLTRLQVPLDGEVLVVGLGNWNATPDAVGPRTVHHLIVTRHFYYMAPPAARAGARPVAGLSPGVLGITGLETAEIVQGVVRQIRPALVVCIDALAARSTERLGTTVQIADAGIQPGSGVGNKRFGITRQTLGVPVLAIGVPTVVHALTVVADGLARVAAYRPAGGGPAAVPAPGQASQAAPASGGQAPAAGVPLPDPTWILQTPPGAHPAAGAPGAPAAAPAGPPPHAPQGPVPGQPGSTAVPAGNGAAAAPASFQREVLEEVLGPYMGDLIMTPKEIDVLVEDVAEMLAEGLNQGLHPDLDLNRLILAATGAGRG
ncbi:MAG TPA: GPR endopeptidase [Limnochordales bacterium]